MKRIDFLKSLAIPFAIPFLSKKEEPQFRPGDITYFDGKNHHPISTAHNEGSFVQKNNSGGMTACSYNTCDTIF